MAASGSDPTEKPDLKTSNAAPPPVVPAPAVPPAVSMAISASPADILWQEKLAGGALGLLRRDTAEAYFANEMADAIAKKNAFRLEYLLTQPLVFRHGLATTAIDPKNGINAAFRKNMHRRDYLVGKPKMRRYPALSEFRGMAPLTHAVRADFADGVKILVKHGAGPFGERNSSRGEDAYYHPALQVAIQFGQNDCLEHMLSSEPFQKDLAERPARVRGFLMEWGIKGGQPETLEYLLKRDPQLLDHIVMPYTGFNQKKRGEDALETAISSRAERGIFDIVLKHKPTTDAKYLFRAIAEKNDYAAQALVEAGVDINARDEKTGATAVMLAAKSDMKGTVSLLLDRGADTQARDTGGRDLVAYAVKSYRPELLGLVLEKASFKPARLMKESKRQHRQPEMALMLKIAAFDGASTFADAASPWQVTGPQQVSVISKDAAAGFMLAEVFNFATGQHTVISRNPDTLKDDVVLREDFAAMKNPKILELAAKHLPKPPGA